MLRESIPQLEAVKVKKSRIFTVIAGILVIIVAGGLIVLANSSYMPRPQTIEKPIPDDQIPR